jgi:integral membrane sensor domain MASE1
VTRNQSTENKMTHFTIKAAIGAAICGALIGLLLGAIVGGLSSALLGQPFSGQTGLKVFHLGMLFPGIVIFGPFTASIGAIVGIIASGLDKPNDKEE